MSQNKLWELVSTISNEGISPDNAEFILDCFYNRNNHVDLVKSYFSNESWDDVVNGVRYELLSFVESVKGEYYSSDAEQLANFMVQILSANGILNNFCVSPEEKEDTKKYLLNNQDLFNDILSDSRVGIGIKFMLEGIFSKFTGKSLHTFTKIDVTSFLSINKEYEPALYLLLSEPNCRANGPTIAKFALDAEESFDSSAFLFDHYGEYVGNLVSRLLYENMDGSFENFIYSVIASEFNENVSLSDSKLTFRFYKEDGYYNDLAFTLISSPYNRDDKLIGLRGMWTEEDSDRSTFHYVINEAFDVKKLWLNNVENFIATAYVRNMWMKCENLNLEKFKTELDSVGANNSYWYVVRFINTNNIDVSTVFNSGLSDYFKMWLATEIYTELVWSENGNDDTKLKSYILNNIEHFVKFVFSGSETNVVAQELFWDHNDILFAMIKFASQESILSILKDFIGNGSISWNTQSRAVINALFPYLSVESLHDLLTYNTDNDLEEIILSYMGKNMSPDDFIESYLTNVFDEYDYLKQNPSFMFPYASIMATIHNTFTSTKWDDVLAVDKLLSTTAFKNQDQVKITEFIKFLMSNQANNDDTLDVIESFISKKDTVFAGKDFFNVVADNIIMDYISETGKMNAFNKTVSDTYAEYVDKANDILRENSWVKWFFNGIFKKKDDYESLKAWFSALRVKNVINDENKAMIVREMQQIEKTIQVLNKYQPYLKNTFRAQNAFAQMKLSYERLDMISKTIW